MRYMGLLLLLLFPTGYKFDESDEVLKFERVDYTLDDLYFIYHSFKIEVAAGETECFYQTLQKEAMFFLEIKVLSGKSKTPRVIDLSVWMPNGKDYLAKYASERKLILESTINESGDYKICIDNTLDRRQSKFVQLLISSMLEDKWTLFANDTSEIFRSVADAKTVVMTMHNRTAEMRQHLWHTATINLADLENTWYARRNVDIMSFVSCIIIVVVAVGQVYFVRHLFYEPKRKFTRAT